VAPVPVPVPVPPVVPDEVPALCAALLAAAVVDAVAVGTAGVRGWKARTAAVPAIVAETTMGARRIGVLPLRT
jgi:hypothetical protein